MVCRSKSSQNGQPPRLFWSCSWSRFTQCNRGANCNVRYVFRYVHRCPGLSIDLGLPWCPGLGRLSEFAGPYAQGRATRYVTWARYAWRVCALRGACTGMHMHREHLEEGRARARECIHVHTSAYPCTRGVGEGLSHPSHPRQMGHSRAESQYMWTYDHGYACPCLYGYVRACPYMS